LDSEAKVFEELIQAPIKDFAQEFSSYTKQKSEKGFFLPCVRFFFFFFSFFKIINIASKNRQEIWRNWSQFVLKITLNSIMKLKKLLKLFLIQF